MLDVIKLIFVSLSSINQVMFNKIKNTFKYSLATQIVNFKANPVQNPKSILAWNSNTDFLFKNFFATIFIFFILKIKMKELPEIGNIQRNPEEKLKINLN